VSGAEPAGLLDDEARWRIATDLRRRLAVDAGAGSGKTTWLVERIVSLVSDERVPMASIAAITFTEAAAAELRLRVRRTLADRAAESPGLLAAAHDVDDAAICTIHAFALRVLSEHWLEAALPPNIEVLDAANEHLDHKTRWQRFTTALLDDPAAMSTMVRAFAAGLRMSHLSAVGHAMVNHHDRLTPGVLSSLENERRRAADPAVDVTAVIGHLERAVAYLPRCTDDSDKLCNHLLANAAPALARLRTLVGSDDEATVISALDKLPRLSAKTGKASNWTIEIAQVRDACAAAEDQRRATLAAVRESVVSDLAWRIASWAVESAAARRDEGRFTFHDLLVESWRLLRSSPDIREAVRDRYRCLLIDEFQDTDPLQAEIAHLLGDPSDGVELARLFVVGDPEQSIYRFRRADIAQFETTIERMDERLALTSNFRSVPEVLRFVDAVFARLLGGTNDPSVAHRSLFPVRAGNKGASAGPAVAVFGGPHREGLARDVRYWSTAEVAATVRSVVHDAWSVHDEGATRPARFGDIAVLLPTRTSLPMLERAFDDAEVPYRLEGATLVWGSQDVRDLLAVVRAAHDPADPIAVVAALRTPALACGDDDLVRYRTGGGSWDPRSPVASGLGAGDPVVDAMARLAELHERRMWMEPSALVGHVLTELHFFELALVHRRPRDHWQRLRWVLDQVRAFDEVRGGTLGDFLDWVDLNEEADRWSSSLGPPEADDDAVRVMTIHGAKGLEFPVVVLTGLDSQPQTVQPPVLFDREGVPRLRFVGDFRSPPYDALSSAETALDRAERLRLLYVALTRARDHLVVDLHHKESTTGALAGLLHPVCEAIPETFVRIVPTHEWTRPEGGQPPADDGPGDWWGDQARWVAQRTALLAGHARQPAWSATALAKAAAPLLADVGSRRAPPVAGDRSPEEPEIQRRIGRAVHDALAKIQLPTDGVLSDDARAVVMASAHSQHLEEPQAARVVGLVESAVSSALVRSIAAGRHWKELPLAAPLEDEVRTAAATPVVEGFADLVGESAGGLVVVDFKTATGRSSAAEYLLQVAVYAYAIRKATGRRVERVVVSYLGIDGTEEEALDGDELETAIAGVLGAA
jgi:ATP-dependent helicase/nuclease subunit A